MRKYPIISARREKQLKSGLPEFKINNATRQQPTSNPRVMTTPRCRFVTYFFYYKADRGRETKHEVFCKRPFNKTCFGCKKPICQGHQAKGTVRHVLCIKCVHDFPYERAAMLKKYAEMYPTG